LHSHPGEVLALANPYESTEASEQDVAGRKRAERRLERKKGGPTADRERREYVAE
jgi:hypothetical protein